MAAVVAAIVVSGCAAAAAAPISSAIFVGIMANDAAQYYSVGPDGKTQVRAPEPDPTRKINEQDCTKPVDFSAGNLRCK
ncbi:MAG TPA: hypothetical protein VIW78_04890 [Burkholderiales bacterium]